MRHHPSIMVCCVSVYACCLLAIASAATVRSSQDDYQQLRLHQPSSNMPVYVDDAPANDYPMYPSSNELFALRLPLALSEDLSNLDLDLDNSNAQDDSLGDEPHSPPHSSPLAADYSNRPKRYNPNRNFIRLGRQPHASSFIRLGRAQLMAQQQQLPEQQARADNFMRYGRRPGSATSFLRLGRGGEQDEAMDNGQRFHRRGDSFIRFGKRAKAAVPMMRTLRSNVGGGAVMMPGIDSQLSDERNLLVPAAADDQNRMARTDKQFIRFGRRDDSFVRLGKKAAGFGKTIDGGDGGMGSESAETALNGVAGGRITDVDAVHAKFV